MSRRLPPTLPLTVDGAFETQLVALLRGMMRAEIAARAQARELSVRLHRTWAAS